MTKTNTNPSGLCQCGCGQRTKLAPRSRKATGWVKGEPIRYLLYHYRFPKNPNQYIVNPKTQCWEWQRAKDKDGYGKLRVNGVAVYAHRYYYEQKYGPIPEGLTIDHLCRNRACVNPEHMECVDIRENILRGQGHAAINARKTHCIRRHPFDESNTYITKAGSRECRKCHKERMKKRRKGSTG